MSAHNVRKETVEKGKLTADIQTFSEFYALYTLKPYLRSTSILIALRLGINRSTRRELRKTHTNGHPIALQHRNNFPCQTNTQDTRTHAPQTPRTVLCDLFIHKRENSHPILEGLGGDARAILLTVFVGEPENIGQLHEPAVKSTSVTIDNAWS